MPLTGGYRKTPVLQVGADIYCDTQLIMLELEKRAPRPPLLPMGREGEARALTMWIDRNIFWSAVGVVMGAVADKLPEAFHKDRSEFSGRPFDPARLQGRRAVGTRPDLCPARAGGGDAGRRPARSFLAARRAWPTARSTIRCGSCKERMGAGKAVPPLDRLPKIVAWSERMKAFGNGKPDRHERDRRARRRQGSDPGRDQRRRRRSQRLEGRPERSASRPTTRARCR